MSDTDRRMSDTDINDVRVAADFRGISFSKFKKSQVKTELVKCLLASKIEQTCNWAAELICAGHFVDLWDTLIFIVSKHIHLGNPKLPIYLARRFDVFKEILRNGYANNELAMRNNTQIRQLFVEIIGVLCYSRKKHSIEPLNIQKKDEFDMTHMASRLKAPSIQYAAAVFSKEDPSELYIAVNELAYHVSNDSKNMMQACYWLEWLIAYDLACNKKKEKCVASTRSHMPVLDKFKSDPIWLVWDVLFAAQPTPTNPLLTKIMQALLDIFSIKFTPAVKYKRRFVLYFAIALLTDVIDFSIEMISQANRTEINFMVQKVDVVYRVIKKNEMKPATDYLTHGQPVERSNTDKTIERLQMMNAAQNL
jgi:hypothetical protein